MQNFSESVEKYFMSELSEQVKYFFNTRREISYLHVMSSLLYKHQWTTKPFHFNSFLVWKVQFIM